MRFNKILKLHSLQQQEFAFSTFVRQSNYDHTTTHGSYYNSETGLIESGPTVGTIPDEIVDEVVSEFNEWHAARIREETLREKKSLEKSELDRKNKQQDMASMLITSGFSFEGYSITKYSGYISGDDVVQIDRGRQGIFTSATDVGESLMESLVEIRRNALQELKEAAHALGCNAVIGVDFDYLTLDPETVNASGGTLYMPYVFGVTANGNAVVIEKAKKVAK